jgi:Tol biopolymer transport system component
LYVINADGSSRHLIRQEAGYHATWSPDGKQIAFDAPTGGDDEFWDIFRIDVDGSDLANLTNTPDKAETAPSWSWTNDRIAYEDWSRESETSVSTIRTTMADGTDVQQLTTGDDAVSPTWSQDGASVYFINQGWSTGCAPILAMVRADGTDETDLMAFRPSESPYSVVWSP